jgi:large subunit ribosomal protein L10
MARPDKAAAVAEITERFRGSSAAVLTEYRGLTVAQLKELRRALGGQTTYAVVKNTLTKIAVRGADMPADTVDTLDPMLEGPTAVAFVGGDPVEAAKGLRDFARTHPLLVIKGGVLDGRPLSADEIRRLADLESREVLLAKMAGALNASLSRAAAMFQAPLAQVARLAEALRQKAEQDPSVLAGGAGAPAPAADVPAVPAAEVAIEASAEAPAEATTDAGAEAGSEATAEASPEATAEAPAETSDDTPAEG